MMLRSIKKYQILISLLLLSQQLWSQDIPIAEHHFCPVFFNPGGVGYTTNTSLTLNHRNQELIREVNYTTSVLTAQIPVYLQSNSFTQMGIGVSVFSNRTINYSSQEESGAALAYSQGVRISNSSELRLGVQGSIYQNRVDFSHHSSGSQWVENQGYVPGLPLGELFESERNTNYSIGTGLFWHQTQQGIGTKSFAGVSVFNVNRPESSYFGASNSVPLRVTAQGGYRVINHKALQLTPEIFILSFAGVSTVRVGAMLSHPFDGHNPYIPFGEGSIDLMTRYASTNSMSVALILHQNYYSVGLSYDFAVSSRVAIPRHSNAFEVVLSVRIGRKRGVKERKEKAVVISDYSIGQIRDFYRESDGKETRDKKEEELKTVEEPLAPRPESERISFELRKDFQFAFNSAELDYNAKEYLDGIVLLMSENPRLYLEIIGHTDDVGSDDANLIVSERRARIVADYIISKGISEDRIRTTPKRDTEPLFPNTTPENRARNRRVEFIISY